MCQFNCFGAGVGTSPAELAISKPARILPLQNATARHFRRIFADVILACLVFAYRKQFLDGS
jgi:hypothetical protein